MECVILTLLRQRRCNESELSFPSSVTQQSTGLLLLLKSADPVQFVPFFADLKSGGKAKQTYCATKNKANKYYLLNIFRFFIFNMSDFEELLRIYYSRLFPYDQYVRWLGAGSAGPSPQDHRAYLAKREFSFTLRDDIYLRYLSFATADDLKQEMVRRLPHKIDIGAVYNARPTDHNKVSHSQLVHLCNFGILNGYIFSLIADSRLPTCGERVDL